MEDGYKSANMKRFIYILFICCAALAVSCQETDTPTYGIDSAVIGEWHLTGAMAEGTPINEDMDVWLCIYSDCTFELYQKSITQSVRYDRFTGTCSTRDNILSGTYSSGMPWGSRYTYATASDALILTSFNLLEEQHYTRQEVPADVRENADEITRAVASDSTPIL